MDSEARSGGPRADEAGVREQKRRLRARIRRARQAARESPDDAARRTALARQACAGHEVVVCYASTGDEPDTWPLIEGLAAAGVEVLLPVLGRREDGSVRHDPDWARYTGRAGLRAGLWGILEPTGPALGAEAIATASFVWCSALAATPSGTRLGMGGGWYDRALLQAAFGATLGALVRETEVLDELPTQPWDRRVDLIVTESRVIRCLGGPHLA